MTTLVISRYGGKRLRLNEIIDQYNNDIIFFTDICNNTNYSNRIIVKYFEDFCNNNNVELEAYKLSRSVKIDKVISFEESDVIRASLIRQNLHIEGQDYNSALHFRNKFIMKELLRKNGISVAKHKRIESMYDIINFIDSNGYPIVIKPISGMFSIQTVLINNYNDLQKWAKNNEYNDKMIERYIEGEMYHVDGLVDNNDVDFLVVSKYLGNCLESKLNTGLGSIVLDQDDLISKFLSKITRKILNTLPTPKNTTFHAEYFVNDDNITLCEIASRTGGVYIPRLINYKTNYNLDEEYLKLELGIPRVNKKMSSKYIGYFSLAPEAATLIDYPKQLPYKECLEYEQKGVRGTDYTDFSMCAGRYVGFYIEANTEKALLELAEEITNYIKVNTRWSRND